MVNTKTITETLATLILQGNVPLRAVAIAGEAIALDAQMNSYDQGADKRSTFDRWSDYAEAYDSLLRRSQSAASDFERTKDGRDLIKVLEEIRADMKAL